MVAPPVERFRKQFSEKNYPFDRSDKRFQGMINREVIRDEATFPGPHCFAAGFRFVDRSREADDRLLMLECFDPHEPFHAPDRFHDAYGSGHEGKLLDWPRYAAVTESAEEVAEIRANFAALVAMCDGFAFGDVGTQLFNVVVDPAQQTPIDRPDVARRIVEAAIAVLEDHDTPDEVDSW